MIRSSIITSLVLSLALVVGCDKNPDGTTPPDDGDGQTADAKGKKDKGKKDKGKKDKGKGKKGDEGDKGEDTAPADETDPTKKVCPAETAEYPEPYFDETVLIRLPKGVSADNFVEMSPGFARLSSKVESVSCIEGVRGAMISFMALAAFQDDPSKDLPTFRDETLEAFGYTGSKLTEEKSDADARFYQAVLEVPPTDAKPEPAKALFQMAAHNGMMYAVVYETHPNAWNALKETFGASAKGMSFLSPE